MKILYVSDCRRGIVAMIKGDAELDTSIDAGMITSMTRMRKITVEIDEQLLHRAQKQSGEGVTGTVRRGLQILAAADAYDKLARMRGKVKFSVDLETMRQDRR